MFGYLSVAQLLINKNSEDPEDPRRMRTLKKSRVLREILCDLAILAWLLEYVLK